MLGRSSTRLAGIVGGALLIVALLPATVLADTAPAITSAARTSFTVGLAGTFTVTTTGTPVITISEAGSLPSGVTFTKNGNGTATLAGTPGAGTSGTWSFTITASNTAGSGNQGFTLTVSPSSNRLVFTTQPGGGTAGTVWSQQPVVKVGNSAGQVVTTDSSTIVYLAISTNPAGGTLTCTSGTSLRVSQGVASFYGCSINLASAHHYSLTATSSPAWTPATSGAFYISGALRSVALTDAIAPGVNRGTSGFGTRSVVVPRNGYMTVLVQTNPNLAGSLLQIWVASKTSGWHLLTLRFVASDGTMHYYARVNGWTAYWVQYAGNSANAPAHSHGRIATDPV